LKLEGKSLQVKPRAGFPKAGDEGLVVERMEPVTEIVARLVGGSYLSVALGLVLGGGIGGFILGGPGFVLGTVLVSAILLFAFFSDP